MPKTPGRSIRVDDELWNAALDTARRRGETLSEVIVARLRRYVRDNPITQPPSEPQP